MGSDQQLNTLAGWRFLITGASRGLGRGLTSSLLAEGATVLALARTASELRSLSDQHAARSSRLLIQEGSMLDSDALKQALTQLHEQAGGCDVLIANAGEYGPREAFHLADSAAWENTVFTNTFGLARSCRACIPALAASGRGQILVIGSAIGHREAIDSSAYAISKAMSWSLVKCLSLELAPLGIAVNELIPGPVNTAMNPGALQLPFCREPSDPAFVRLIAYLCGGCGRPPSGQSFALRVSP